MAEWLKEAKDNDIVISTRVRLARNIAKLPFPHKLRGTDDEQKIYDTARKAFEHTDFRFVDTHKLSEAERMRAIEQHVLSRELIKLRGKAIIAPDESMSIMVMEEDHFRLQCIKSGFMPDETMAAAKELDAMLAAHAEYAFDKDLGYLTSCPTNVGTGMRISAMLHLPALGMSGALGNILASLSSLGFTARGIMGEGTQALGNVYQVSNQVTLGVSEEDIIKNAKAVVSKITESERNAAQLLDKASHTELRDSIMRALGLLKFAETIDTREAMGAISLVNLGLRLNWIEGAEHSDIYALMMDIMPGGIGDPEEEQRDIKRAAVIRKAMEGLKKIGE